jgi:hypothetical protein
MKTMKFRLLATIITLAAVITATNPVNAQRRATTNGTNNEKVENTRTDKKENIEKKSTFRDVAIEPKSANRISNEKHPCERNRVSSNRGNSNSANWKSDVEKSIANAAEMNRRSTGIDTGNRKSGKNEYYNLNRPVNNSNAERYNHNTNDARYNTSKEYSGSNKYWSSENRGDNNSAKNYNYNCYKHWDRNWENYRWNHNSWRNYYGYYNPYSFRSHKYYYHHPYYGHVIRKFVYRPQIYVHNNVRYYCYDGYFFRYRGGVGYVLVDVPFGMSFEYLPNDYEKVFINGYLYFRVGNLFFERTNYGFLLVHYPERYFAYNEGYRCEGFNDFNF